MITYRILPPEEYDKLQQHPDLASWIPDPNISFIVVGEDGDKIVTRSMAITYVHIEGTWVHPDYRKTSAGFRAFQAIKRFLDQFRVSKAFCWADSPIVGGYLQRLGCTKLPVDTFVLDIS